jgi:uncharacterized Zn-finger protein
MSTLAVIRKNPGHAARPETASHPCFDPKARARWARVHLPVAPACNVSCNFCDRRFDCTNESRPGVTSVVLSPWQAAAYLDGLVARRQDVAVVGIAGPGDPMANPDATLETLRLVRARHPACCCAWPATVLPWPTRGRATTTAPEPPDHHHQHPGSRYRRAHLRLGPRRRARPARRSGSDAAIAEAAGCAGGSARHRHHHQGELNSHSWRQRRSDPGHRR